MLLSDREIRSEIAAGRIVIRPFDEDLVQPSSIDIRVGSQFRVFHNYRYRVIDVKQRMDDLTELVEAREDEPFIVHPGEFALGSTLEWVQFPNDIAGRLEGKALSVATEVPTPNGWKTMADLQPGDYVFDEAGLPTLVLAATTPLLGRPCRELTFSDRTTVMADLNHGWITADKNAREHHARRLCRVTTREIEEKLRVRKEINHHVPLTAPVRYPRKHLPIDPYLLGIWLGDGTTTKAEITCNDEFILKEIRKAGYEVRPASNRLAYRIGGTGHTRDPQTGRYERNDSLSSRLRNMGLLGFKFIPEDFLQGSIVQRLDLLCGLMDSDGYVDEWGRCEFSSGNERLADGFTELACGLGFRPVKSKSRSTLYGVDCGPRYRVRFTPQGPVFRLPRKLARQRPKLRQYLFRGIVDVREVASAPVRCIEVASPRGMFLITRSFIPTHNSSLGRLGLVTHSTAGFIDPSFEGHLTLELSNMANLPITLYPGMKIGQIAFLRLSSPAERPYGADELRSKYKGQRGPTPSRYWENFREE